MSCPVCFNAAASDDTVRASLNLGIFVMLGFTGCVLAGFLRFIVSIARRSSGAELSGAELNVRRGADAGPAATPVKTTGLQAGLRAGTT